jgi:hypothetical protein
MNATFADDLMDGFRQVAEVLSRGELEILARARDSINEDLAERNRILAQLILAYRRGPRQLWAPVLLDLLAPALIDGLGHFRAQPPVLDEQEIRHQLVMEVLEAATTIPTQERGRRLRLRLMSQASRAVVRWLEREGIRQNCQDWLDEMEEAARG